MIKALTLLFTFVIFYTLGLVVAIEVLDTLQEVSSPQLARAQKAQDTRK